MARPSGSKPRSDFGRKAIASSLAQPTPAAPAVPADVDELMRLVADYGLECGAVVMDKDGPWRCDPPPDRKTAWMKVRNCAERIAAAAVRKPLPADTVKQLARKHAEYFSDTAVAFYDNQLPAFVADIERAHSQSAPQDAVAADVPRDISRTERNGA